MKMLGTVAVGIVRESRKFSGRPYVGRIVWSSLRWYSFHMKFLTDFIYRNFPGDRTARFFCNNSRFPTRRTKCNNSSFRYENSSASLWSSRMWWIPGNSRTSLMSCQRSDSWKTLTYSHSRGVKYTYRTPTKFPELFHLQQASPELSLCPLDCCTMYFICQSLITAYSVQTSFID